MEQNQSEPSYTGYDPSKDIDALKNTEAFAQMANDISMNDLSNMSQAQEQPSKRERPASNTESQPNEINMNEYQEKERNRNLPSISHGPQGPKYMEALTNIIGIADIRSIEAQLPILKSKVEVSPLTGKEEQALRSASVSPESFLKKINELLYNHTKFNDRTYASFNDFLGDLFPPDKSVLIWALLSSTYLVLPTVEKECETCNKKYIVDSSPSDIIHGDSITKMWDKELSPNDYTVTQSVLGGYLNFEFGMPSERDRLILTRVINPEKAKDTLEKTGSLLSYVDNVIFFAKTVTVGTDDERIVLTDVIQDIHPFLNNIPPKVADAIKSSVDLTVFDEYMPDFYLETVCDHCKSREKISIDPEIAFFRKTISL